VSIANLTIADIPFIEQVADQLHPLPSLIEACGGLGDARHRWALAHVARRAPDEDTIRAITDAADTGDPDDNDILTAIARNPATPLDVMLRLAANRYVIVSELAASDPRIPAEETVRLAGGCLGSRFGVAMNPNTPPAVLAMLAGDKSVWIRCRAGKNPRTPLAAVRRLIAADPEPNVRLAATSNPALPDADIAALAEAADSAVIEGLVISEALTESAAWRIFRRAARTRAIAASNHALLQSLARNPATPPLILDKLARMRQARSWELQAKVITNPSAGEWTLRFIADTGCNRWHRELAGDALEARWAIIGDGAA
jgi:hypothetical protein